MFIQDWDINSLYAHQPTVINMSFSKYKLIDSTNADGVDWYQVRVYTQSIENWILSHDDDRWDFGASSVKMADGANYWIHGSLYTMMILKWPVT